MPPLVLSSLNFIAFFQIFDFFTGSKLIRDSNTKFFLSLSLSISQIKNVSSSFMFHFLVSLEHNCSTCSSSLVTLNRPSNNSRLKLTNRSFHHIAPALGNSLPPDLRHFPSHSIFSQPNLQSPVFSLSPSVFLKNSPLILFFSTLVSRPRLPLDGYLRK
jgi:hypothetical protein